LIDYVWAVCVTAAASAKNKKGGQMAAFGFSFVFAL
jgi:hypothetical protein